jgi:hypothetical protein
MLHFDYSVGQLMSLSFVNRRRYHLSHQIPHLLLLHYRCLSLMQTGCMNCQYYCQRYMLHFDYSVGLWMHVHVGCGVYAYDSDDDHGLHLMQKQT